MEEFWQVFTERGLTYSVKTGGAIPENRQSGGTLKVYEDEQIVISSGKDRFLVISQENYFHTFAKAAHNVGYRLFA